MRSLVMILGLLVGAVPCFAASALQDAPQPADVVQRREATVVGAVGRLVVLDLGSRDGIRIGDEVQLFLDSGANRQAIVRSLTEKSCRAELAPLPGAEQASAIPIGTRAEVMLSGYGGDGERAGDSGLTWQAPVGEWDPNRPLLAPAKPLRPEERQVQWHGRTWLSFDFNRDDQGVGSDSWLGRVGADYGIENLFGRGGMLEVDAEFWTRGVDTPDTDETDTRLRLDRFSYAVGGHRFDDQRWQVGRFLQNEFPQFGVLDGVEFGLRTQDGNRVGMSLGFQPEPTGEQRTGDDVQVALTYRYLQGENNELELGAAFQKTWHRGDEDRDLLVLTTNWAPTNRFSLIGSAWVDFFTSSSDPEDGADLSEAHVDATWRLDDRSVLALFLSHFTFPVLLRNEFTPLPDDEILDAKVSRAGLRGWRELTDDVRLSARLDHWKDEVDDGGGGEISLTQRRPFGLKRTQLSADLFVRDGQFTKLTGARVRALTRTDLGSWRASLEASDYDREGLSITGATNGARYRLRGGWDTSLGRGWSLSLDAESRFGEDQSSWSTGVFLQRRF